MSVFSVMDFTSMLQDFSFPHGVQKLCKTKIHTNKIRSTNWCGYFATQHLEQCHSNYIIINKLLVKYCCSALLSTFHMLTPYAVLLCSIDRGVEKQGSEPKILHFSESGPEVQAEVQEVVVRSAENS
jgi:hypothetical protein